MRDLWAVPLYVWFIIILLTFFTCYSIAYLIGVLTPDPVFMGGDLL